MFVFLILFFHLTSAIPHRVSQNTLVLFDSTSDDSKPIIYAVNGGFGPSEWPDGSLDSLSIVTIDDICSTDKLPSKEDLPSSEFVVVTKRSGCAYLRKAENIQQINASALILINQELEEGLLFPPLPELSYFSSSESIKIPVMLVKQPSGELLSQNSFVSIYCAKSGNRTLIHAWNFHWIFWFIVFSLLLVASLVSLFAISREPSVNPIIRPCILLTMLCAVGIPCLK